MKLHKKEIAKRQIETAIDLFLTGKDYLSVVTLSGAAEEILGELLTRYSKKNVYRDLLELYELISRSRALKAAKEEIIAYRNSLKHDKDRTEDEVEVPDDQEHAVAMITRSLYNYSLLEGELSNKMEQFLQWLEGNRPDLFRS